MDCLGGGSGGRADILTQSFKDGRFGCNAIEVIGVLAENRLEGGVGRVQVDWDDVRGAVTR